MVTNWWRLPPKSFPRGEGGPRRGSEEECGRKSESQHNESDLHKGRVQDEMPEQVLTLIIIAGCRPHSSSVTNRFRRADSLTARNCGVIAPGNHWISDSLRGAPPPGEAFGWKPATCLTLIHVCGGGKRLLRFLLFVGENSGIQNRHCFLAVLGPPGFVVLAPDGEVVIEADEVPDRPAVVGADGGLLPG